MKQYVRIISSSLMALLFLNLVARADDPLKAGKEALEKGDFVAAIVSFQEAVHKDKKNPEPYLLLGTAYFKADSLDEAVAALVQARELDPSNAMVYVLLGDTYVKQNIHPAAVDQYQRAVAYDSTRPEIFMKLARSEKKVRQYNEAAVAYVKAIRLDTANVIAYRELCDLYLQAKLYASAVPLLRHLVEKQPDELSFQVLLVKALFQSRSYDELIPVAQKVMQRDSSQTEMIHMLAAAYAKMHDNENSEKMFTYLEHHDTLKAEEYVKLAQAQKSLDKADDAVESFEKAYCADSTLGETYYDLGTLYMKRKQYNEAVAMFDKKIASDTTSAYLFASHLNEAICLMQVKEFERARVHVLASVKIRPDYVPGWSALASCYAQMDSSDQEENAYQRVIELATASNGNGTPGGKYTKELREAYRTIGIQSLVAAVKDKDSKTNKAKYIKAAEYLENALKIEPKDCEALLWTAQAFQNSNNRDKAKKYYCKEIEMCPKSKQAEESQKILDSLGLTCGE